MPELPEVETVRRVLAPQTINHIITDITCLNNHVVAYPVMEQFVSAVKGQVISSLERRGKYLIFRFESGDRMLVHLRMTGVLLFTPDNMPHDKHLHILFQFEHGFQLRFHDQRRFGRIWFFRQGEIDTISSVESLGLEPDDPQLTGDYLSSHWHNSRRAIKSCLLDQHVVAGIGNIYADESLFAAHIPPMLPANQLTSIQWNILAAAIPKIIDFAVEKNAISPEDYLLGKGADYRNTPFLAVYGHANEPCPLCGRTLRHTVVGGRGTVYCPNCQDVDK